MCSERKGQISLEFLLVITFFLAVMAAIVIPMARTSIHVSRDTSVLGEVRGFGELIKSNIEIAGSEGPGSRKTIQVSVPSKLYQIRMNGNYTLVMVCNTTRGLEEIYVNASYLTALNSTFSTDIYNSRGKDTEIRAETFYNDSHEIYVRLRVA
ncbi:MAG: hypothetical protein ACE5K4_01290 [Candidatus Hydrothermarchaeota archaeon]